jgi:uncharacterized membrane protein (UPF0127 family)
MAAPGHTNCTLFTASGVHQLALRTANSLPTRFRGLMLNSPLGPTEGMLITRCPSVHTAFMRYPIDVVYLDRFGVVTGCVPRLRPWRASHSRICGPWAAHTLELASGAISAFGIVPGDILNHPCLEQPVPMTTQAPAKQGGSAMIEFAVVGPLIALLGLGTVQYSMLFFAKNQINYASFMAAREGALAHADLNAIQKAYAKALAPMYGGGETQAEVAQSAAKASTDMAGNVRVEMLNPTKESFEWNDPTLQALLKTGSRRVIPNGALASRLNQAEGQGVGSASGQSLQDANMLKLKVTHGYLPKVPIIGKLYLTYLKWADPHTDDFQTKLINDGRIPVVTHVTLEMQSDAIEPDNAVSIPGPGNGGSPTDPGNTPAPQGPPPDCADLSCKDPAPPDSPDPEPACNPFTDPNHCASPACDSAQMCCIPPEWTPKT